MDLDRNKWYLFIFRHKELIDHYIIIYGPSTEGESIFQKIGRTGSKYGVPPADGVPYAHPYYPLEKVLITDDCDKQFAEFIKKSIATPKLEPRLANYGWYILSEINIEKWKADYQLQLTKERDERMAQIKVEKKPAQTSLF